MIDRLWHALESVAELHGTTLAEAAARAGLPARLVDPDTRERCPSEAVHDALLDAIGADEDDVLDALQFGRVRCS